MKRELKKFYQGKKVFITGHTGFKGAWLCQILLNFGATVSGYALLPEGKESLFNICSIDKEIDSHIGDIRDFNNMKKVIDEFQPDLLIHMAAQPLVRESFIHPKETYEINVMGTVNILECIKDSEIKSFLNVTTDKVYKNKEWVWGYRENEELNGLDPYSNSKSCSELVTQSYKEAFFKDKRTAISTMRAGNVIGGGDFAKDRIIPDCVRAVAIGEDIIVRNPYSTRPYQHVMEPLMGYLLLMKEQYEDIEKQGYYNIGPDERECVTTGELVTLFCDYWNEKSGGNIRWINKHDGGPHEANFLKLDCSYFKSRFHWNPQWDIKKAVEKTTEWYYLYLANKNMRDVTDRQILEFLG